MNIHQNYPILFALFFWGAAFGQEKLSSSNSHRIIEIVIDLNDEKGIDPVEIDKYNALEKGQFFRLKIDNVNTYLYDVSVVNDDVDTSAELPASLLDLVDFGGIKSSLVHLNSVSGVVKQFVALDPNAGLRPFDLGQVQTTEDLKKYFGGVKSDYKSVFESIGHRYTEVDAIFARAEHYQNTMKTLERDVLGTRPSENDIKVDLKSFEEAKADLFATMEKLIQNNARFLAILETNKDTIAKNRELKAASTEIKKVYDALIKASDNLMAQLSTENYRKFSEVLIAILNNLDFRYTTLPIQRYSDVNELVITLKPRDKNAKLSGYSTTLRIPDIEKTFWGISTGFYVTDNPESNYSIVERVANGQTFYDFLEEDTANVELGINTMVRYGRRVGEILDTPTFWHFGFGAGLSIDQKFKPRLMAGTGLAFGSKNKLFVDFGALHMYYNTLSKAYTLEDNSVLPKDFMVNATKIKGYVSLGYLISL